MHAGPEAQSLAREASSELHSIIVTLPSDQQEALALRYGAGLTARDIGRVLGKREEAAQKLLWRALQIIRERYHHD